MIHGLLTAVASLIAEHGLWSVRASVVATDWLQRAGSVAVVLGLSCSSACGIFLDLRWNVCPLNLKVDS